MHMKERKAAISHSIANPHRHHLIRTCTDHVHYHVTDKRSNSYMAGVARQKLIPEDAQVLLRCASGPPTGSVQLLVRGPAVEPF